VTKASFLVDGFNDFVDSSVISIADLNSWFFDYLFSGDCCIMKYAFTLVALLLISEQCYSQPKFETSIALGLGASVEKKFSYSDKKDQARIVGSIAQYFNINLKFSFGVELIASTKFLSYYIHGDSGPAEGFDPQTNTRILNYNNLNASSYLLKAKYYIGSGTILRPFVGTGIGASKYVYKNVVAEKDPAKVSLVYAIELGISWNRATVSCKSILGGQTPSFSGFDKFNNSNVLLTGIRSHQIYFSFAYNIFQFPRNR
jgi:hypothetical protein